MNLNKIIKEKSDILGIDLVGITDYEKVSDSKISWLEERKEKKYITEFEEEELKIRVEKNQLLDNAKSIVVIGMSYNTDIVNDKIYPRGNLSKISLGLDYHKVLEDKLEKLKDELLLIINFKYKIYVDTGPLIDRELAYQAGLGFYGKNCSIINEDYGSFIAIGYMLTNLEIENDEIQNDGCGECRLCLEACPTSALFEEYKINPKNCISYLTQSKEIPIELRNKMGMKIYGCDTCQLVCPKNKNVKKSTDIRFNSNNTIKSVDILELLSMSNKSFKAKYGHMSGSWRGKNVLKRNGLIALGNLKDKNFIPDVEEQLDSESEIIKEAAQWALKEMRGTI